MLDETSIWNLVSYPLDQTCALDWMFIYAADIYLVDGSSFETTSEVEVGLSEVDEFQ